MFTRVVDNTYAKNMYFSSVKKNYIITFYQFYNSFANKY